MEEEVLSGQAGLAVVSVVDVDQITMVPPQLNRAALALQAATCWGCKVVRGRSILQVQVPVQVQVLVAQR